MKDMIAISNLTKKFRRRAAVDRLTLSVPAGSIFALLGPNGAGKTTLMRMLVNIVRPDSGSARVLEVDSRKLGEKEFQQIGYVAESQKVPEWMTVREFLDYCRSFYPRWDDDFCKDLLKRLDLAADEKLKHLSRGMVMKAKLVSSLAYRPRLLILDEPFSGLDPTVREDLMAGILELTESEEWTVFLSSHDIEEVERLADRVAFLHQGQLKVNETLEALQLRFKRVVLRLPEPPAPAPRLPEGWLFPEHDGRVLRFVDSRYQSRESEKEYARAFPSGELAEVQGMSMREIFLVQAEQLKMLNL